MEKAKLYNIVLLLIFTLPILCKEKVNKNLLYSPGGVFVKKQITLAIKPKVAIITIDDNMNFIELQYNLISIAKNESIKGIILFVSCGGGSTSEFGVIHDLIKRIDKEKPIVCFIERSMSAGYLISSACRYIIATSMADIGSIGVIWHFDKHKNVKVTYKYKKADLVSTVFTAGKYKAATSNIYHELTKEEKNYLNERCLKTYESIIKKIANNRKISLEKASHWAEGKVFEASEALDLKLIDQIGTMFDAEEKIIYLINEKDPEVNYNSEIEPIFFNSDE